MSSLFIAGNGFDISHGIQSKYSDFRSYIINKYPDAIKYKNEIVLLDELENLDFDEFSAEILINAMDKASGNNWNDFETALGYINFDDKFPLPNHKENETDEEDQQLMQQYIYYMMILSNVYIDCSKQWQVFFNEWLKSVQYDIDNNAFLPKEDMLMLFNSQDMLYFSFNYTKTLQKLYGIKKVIHIHNRVGQKLIFGHGRKENDFLYDNVFSDKPAVIYSSDLDDMIVSFRKDTESPLKKYKDFFKSLNCDIDEVYSYGFSYGNVDSVYIKKIVERISPNAVWYFSKYEWNDKKSLRIKKIKLRRYGFKGTFSEFNG